MRNPNVRRKTARRFKPCYICGRAPQTKVDARGLGVCGKSHEGKGSRRRIRAAKRLAEQHAAKVRWAAKLKAKFVNTAEKVGEAITPNKEGTE